ncbi:MAG: ribosome maturation factor RimM [Clostridiales bacterium]|nr:ribosome maturation factor RimM [Clostridiales bacterium]
MSFITIGQVLKASGIKGEIKVKPLTDDPKRYHKLRLVYLSGRPYRLLGVRIGGGFVYLRLADVEDRNAADALRDRLVEIDRVNAVPLEEDRYFISDIIGCAVSLSDGADIGRVTAVSPAGGADVFTVTDGRRTARFPFLKKLAVSVDTENKRIVLDGKIFSEVGIYED